MAGFVGFVSFLVCIITLAVSPERWETFKRMIITLTGAAVGIFAIGALAARILDSGFVWYLTGELMVSCGILAAAIAGMLQVWAIKHQ